MKNYRLIFNPQCSKSRQALTFLEQESVHFKQINYLSGELTKDLLYEIKTLLKVDFIDLIRQKEKAYLDLELPKNLNDEEWINLILKNPIILERPILLDDESGIIARPPELILDFI